MQRASWGILGSQLECQSIPSLPLTSLFDLRSWEAPVPGSPGDNVAMRPDLD